MPVEWIEDSETPTMPRAATGSGLQDAPQAPSLGAVAGAAFRQENVVGAAIDLLTTPQWFKPEAGYNPIADIEGTPYLRDHADAFVISQSQAQTQSIKARIDRETKDRETVAAGGFSGLVASVAAGTLDPTILLPGVVAVKGARGVSAARTALASAAAVGAGAAVQETVLQADQVTRTAEETAYGVAGATILGGILGGAAGVLTRREFEALATKIEDVARGADGAGGPRAASAGAAAAADARGTGELADAFGLQKMKAVTNLSPVTRLQASEFDVARNTVRDIADAGLNLAENAEGIPTSLGGNIENRVKMHNGGLGKAIGAMDEAYGRYYLDKPTVSSLELATLAPRQTWARLTGGDGGKLTAREFREEVGKAMIRGDDHPIAEVSEIAKAYRREVFDPLKKLAQEVGVLPKDVEATTAQSYLTRVYNHEKIIHERADFVGRLVAHLEGGQAAATSRVENIKGRRFTAETEVERIKSDLAEQVIPIIGQARRVSPSGDGVPGVQTMATRLREERRAAGADERVARADLTKAQRDLQAETDAREAQSARAAKRLLADLKRGKAAGPMPTLATVIRTKGGIRTARFNLVGDLMRVEERGVDLKEALDGGLKGIINNRSGRDIEDVLNDAILDGYLPADATMDTLVDALRRSAAGEKIYSNADGATVDYTRALESMTADLERAGFDIDKMTPDDLRQAMQKSGAGGDAEKAAIETDARLDELAARIQQAADAYDPKALRLDDLDAAIRELDELAPTMRAEAKKLRQMLTERGREMRGMDRESADAQRFADLSPAEVRDIAEEVTDTILGNASRLPGIDMVAGPRGPLKERTLKIPDELIEDYLEKDVERVARIYTRTMSADAELARKFGDVAMEGPLAALRDEKNARIAAATTGAERTRIEGEYQNARRDLEALRDRVRGTYRMPEDARALTYRSAKVMLHLNYMARLGGMTVSAITDMARPIMRYGLTSTFRDGFMPLVTEFKSARLAAEEVKLAGTALDMVIENRTQAMGDLFDDFQRGSKFERAVEYGAAKFGMVALMSPWNGAMKQLTGTIAMSEILRAAKAVKDGTASPRQVANLAASGIDAGLASRISDQFSRFGEQSLPPQRLVQQVRDFVKSAAGVHGRKVTMDLGQVQRADEIAEALGIKVEDLDGYKHTVDNSALNHALKNHGNDAKEAAQGQVGLTEEDFARIPDILQNFDFVSPGGSTKQGRETLIYEKAYGDVVVYVEEVRTGKRELAMVSMRKMREGTARADAGTPAPNVRNDAAIGDRVRRRVSEDKAGGATVDGVMLPNTENWVDGVAREAFRAAIVREVDNVIVTPGLEKPLWTSYTLGRVISQFKGFGLASTQRVLIAGLQQKDAAFLSGAALSLGLGAMVYAIKSQIRGEEEAGKMRNASLAKWAVEATDNSGMLSLPFEANNIMEKVTGGRVGLSAVTGEQASRYASRNAIGALLGPSFDTVGKGLQIVGNAASGDWTASDTHALRALLPGQNLFYLRSRLNEVENAFNAAVGVPAKRQAN